MTETGLSDRLKGCRAVVSGGANGIGAAIVRRLRAEDASVLICDRDEAAGRALAQETRAELACFDVMDIDALDRAVAAYGPVEILVNNVGVDQHAFLTDTRPEEWRRLLGINLESAFAFTRAVLPGMQAAGYGRIVTVSSEAGRLGSKGAVVYASAKGGLIAFAKSVARENARFAITSNVVLPGPVRTPLFEAAVAGGGDQILEAMKGATLLRRIGEPEEVASAVAFLASREAGFITGEVLGVSGGMGLG